MATRSFSFDRFQLDPADRRLTRDDVPVELNARYLDALTLLVSEQGKLVTKDRFLDEVWSGVPVTDEALTQCIRTLRRQLGDSAERPRFIETVPKHGYRFIAPVEEVDGKPVGAAPAITRSWREFVLLGLAGLAGGAVAGIVGGLVYGFAAAIQPLDPGVGAVSILLVLLSLTIVVALIGAAGVAFGIAAAAVVSGRLGPSSVVGGAIGGLLVGAFVKLLGLDAFTLLVGQSPGDITGAAEGAVLGGAVGLGAWLGTMGSRASLRQSFAAAAAASGFAGILIALLGGRLMGGSLALLGQHLPESRLRLDSIGALFGESGFGPLTQASSAAVEGALFGGCVAGAMLVARRQMGRTGPAAR